MLASMSYAMTLMTSHTLIHRRLSNWAMDLSTADTCKPTECTLLRVEWISWRRTWNSAWSLQQKVYYDHRHLRSRKSDQPSSTITRDHHRSRDDAQPRCFYCYETGHITENCRHGGKVECCSYKRLGHKTKFCHDLRRMRSQQSTQRAERHCKHR